MATVTGTNAGETKIGTSQADSIYGYGGNDSLYGRAGNDQIWGGIGDDYIWGEDGNDSLVGEDGADAVWGGNGTDVISGGLGDDKLYGDAGTDTLSGDAGNDTIKGGTGISHLFGGAGYDTLYYDPTTSDINAVGDYLSSSYLEGEHVIVYNKATLNGAPARTIIGYGADEWAGDGRIWFGSEDPAETQINVGTIEQIPGWISVVGSGGLSFHGDRYNGHNVTGTSVDDFFSSGYMGCTFVGGPGNDTFYIAGDDTIISEPNDADIFDFEPLSDAVEATVTGFNGSGTPGGDVIHFDANPVVTEINGTTVFELFVDTDLSQTITVDAVGLAPGTDWFVG